MDYKKCLSSVNEKFDLIFIDPPYKMGCIPDVLNRLCDANVIAPNAFIVCESGSEDIFQGEDGLKARFEIQKQARYSISYITVLRPKMEN